MTFNIRKWSFLNIYEILGVLLESNAEGVVTKITWAGEDPLSPISGTLLSSDSSRTRLHRL